MDVEIVLATTRARALSIDPALQDPIIETMIAVKLGVVDRVSLVQQDQL